MKTPDVWTYTETGVTNGEPRIRLLAVFLGRADAELVGRDRCGEPVHDDALGLVWRTPGLCAEVWPMWYRTGRALVLSIGQQ